MKMRKLAPYLALAGVLVAALGLGLDWLRGEPLEIGSIQLALILVGLGVALLAGWWLAPALYRLAYRGLSILALGLAALGLLLLAINGIGSLLNLRDPQVAVGFTYGGVNRQVDLSASEVEALIARQAGESNGDYARRLTDVVFGGMIHYWTEDGNQSLRVPIWENWLLWATGLNPYEFCDPNKAIERGVGVCSQFSKILTSVLQADGGFADVYPYALDGHVVTQALINIDEDGNESWWVLDADYGVVLEHSMAYLETHPDEVFAAYRSAGYDVDIAARIRDYYGPEGNYAEGNAGYCAEEALRYRQKWSWPLLMLAPGALVLGINWASRRRQT